MVTEGQTRQFNELIDILSKELLLYYRLIDLAKKEKSAVIDSNLDALSIATREKASLVQNIEELESDRMRLLVNLAASLNIAPEELTLNDLADWADNAKSEKLQWIRAELISVNSKLQKENHFITNIISHRITLLNNSVNILNGVLCQDPTYIQTGQFHRAGEGGFLFSGKI